MVTKKAFVAIVILALLSSAVYGNIVVMAIDRSGSSSNQLVKAKATMPAIVEQLQPGDDFWLIVFDNMVDQSGYTITQENMESTKNEILNNIDAIQTTSSENEDGTEIIDAWRVCIMGLNQTALDEEKRICVFISDGEPDKMKVIPELPELRCRPNIWLIGYTNFDHDPNLLKIITGAGINPTLIQLDTIDQGVRAIESAVASGHEKVIAKIKADEEAAKAKESARVKAIVTQERIRAQERVAKQQARAAKTASQYKQNIKDYAQRWWWVCLVIVLVLIYLATKKRPQEEQDKTVEPPVVSFQNISVTLTKANNEKFHYSLELKDGEFFMIGENQFIENPSIIIEDTKGYMKLWYDAEGLHIVPEGISISYYKGDQVISILTPIILQQDPVTLMIGDDQSVTITTQET